eukprot:Tamp_13524.p1 GENE.Tamp_13524~~Tamp_13524.p1  ORF type:complete len:402 (-),score=81.95 Tamp_13524:113-1318(-)
MQSSVVRSGVQWLTRRQDAGRLPAAFYHAARAQRPKMRPVQPQPLVLKIVKLPPSLRRLPRAAPAMTTQQQLEKAHLVEAMTSAQVAQYAAAAGHSAGDIPTVYARPILEVDRTPQWIQAVKENGAHALLAGGAAGMAGLALFNAATCSAVFFTPQLAQTMLMNIPTPFLCAAAGDVVAQVVTGTREISKLDRRRILAAGLIGGVLQGFGTTAWLWHLNHAIPRSMVGFDNLSQGAWLLAKVLFDSAAWGTVINTLNVGARRVAAGDSVIQAYSTWKDKIVSITKSEYKFWPAFGAVIYTCVPEAQQVNGFGFGGLIWSIYLSYAANHGVSSNQQGFFRYGRPTGVRIKAPTSSLDEPEMPRGQMVLARFNVKSSELPLHGAVGRPRISRPNGMCKRLVHM